MSMSGWDWLSIVRDEADTVVTGGHGGRVLKYPEAVREALSQALAADPSVYVMGQGVDDPDGMFGCTRDLHVDFGGERVFDTPLSEDALMGVATGSALTGMRPVYMHNRPDFLLLTLDQLVNHASKWRYMFGGRHSVPMVVWAAIGRGWGSGAQHSQAPQAIFAHVPGLKVVMPSTAYDAKGLLLAAIADQDPIVIIEHRWAMRHASEVPEEMYFVPIGKGVVRREGTDVTIAGTSHALLEAQRAAEELAGEGISCEVVDLRTVRPLDEELLLNSVAKTGRLVVVDTGWKTGGITAEVAAVVAEKGADLLKANVVRLGAPDCPTPAGYTLEAAFYLDKDKVARAVRDLLARA
ncbi:MAG: transketolase C-terminal domain-containing protein [Coriobacteriia bacterium]